MKTLYFDCSMGAAGDMLTAALLELIPDQDAFIEEMNSLGIPGVHVKKKKSSKCGITGTSISVTIHGKEEDVDIHHHEHIHDNHHHEHCHNSLHDIEHIVRDHLNLSQKIQDDIMKVYTLIAEAESKAHGKPITDVHFHEVGTMDAIADITAVCILMNKIAPDQVIVSPVNVGSGQVMCAHGILPVPAPATAHILREVPIYSGNIRGELCTPTGAALLKYFATRFGDMPIMTTKVIGYGMGKKDFEAANCVRVLLGETANKNDMVAELFCNVDDMTAENLGFAMEVLFSAGALEVYTVPVGMKKSRPGTLLCVMCRLNDRDKFLELIFKHTTTIGIREQISNRYTLERSIEAVDTLYGTVKKKVSKGYGVHKEKYEYEDLADIARKEEISIAKVLFDILTNS